MFSRFHLSRLFAFAALLLCAARPALAAVEISGVSATNVGATAFTMVWMTSEISTPDLEVFSDSAGATNVTATLALEFFPLTVGDPAVAHSAADRTARRALELKAINRRVVSVRVSGASPGSTYHVLPRTFGAGGVDNGSGPVPLTVVTTAQFTSFVIDGRLLAVRFPGVDAEGDVALIHGPAGIVPLSAIVGDGAPADTAVFNLAHLVDLAAGTNALFNTPQPFVVTVLGAGAPAGAFPHTIDFSPGFRVGGFERFETGAANPAPAITTHPANRTVLLGQTAMFTVAAVGDPAPTYQWQRLPAGGGTWSNLANDATYSGVTTGTLTVAGTTQVMTGDQFRAIASNGVPPAATSNAATLTVNLSTSSVTLSNLAHAYDGTPKSATATTTPAGLSVAITYNGSTTPPTNAGSYEVVATITQTGYSGFATGTLVIARIGQTITFAELADHTLGAAPFAINGTSSSGLALSFSVVSGPATIDSNTVTLTGAGTVTIRATQSGNGNYHAAPPVDRSFRVEPGTATVTLGALGQTYTGTPRPVTVTTNPGGLDVTITYAGASAAPANVGSYAVVATVQDANYTGSAAGVLVINRAPLIARADHKSKVQGTPNPALTITYLGLLAGQTSAVVDTPPVAATAATAGSPAGTYPITLTGGSDDNYDLTRQNGTLTITPSANVAPTINRHPQSQSVTVNSPVTFVVEASGTAPLSYQWFKNGAALSGATNATLSLASAAFSDAGSYSVRVSNLVGQAVSHLATLAVKAPPGLPTIVNQPDDLTVRRRAKATFSVRAVGHAPLVYQWRKGGSPILGANRSTYTIKDTEASDAGLYSVTVSNPVGIATSRNARLTISGRSWKGTYFGSFGNNGGTCAFYIRDDNTGIFCGYARNSRVPLLTRDCRVDDDGRFRFTSGPRAFTPPGLAAAEITYEFDLLIAEDGSVTGTVSGLNLTVTAALSPVAGATQEVAGFYESGAANSGDVTYTIVGSAGEAYAVAVVGAVVDAGLGTVDAAGHVDILTENSAIIDATVHAQSATINTMVIPLAGPPINLVGGNNDVREEVEKLINISTRGPTSTGDNIVIAGFVVAGDQPKTVLIRAIGPTLTRFNVPGALSAATLRLYSGPTLIASAGDWGAASNADDIATAGARVYAFDLPFDSHDSAMLITLEPGAYTAHIFGPDGETGVSLAEVYDATEGPIPGNERVLNISTRGLVGTGDDVQIAGFVILGSVPKRVLIRGVGPGLAPHGISGFLADPTITLYDVRGVALLSNDNWSSGANASLIQEVSARVYAFPLASDSNDAVLLVNLQPGVYTVHVRGANGTTGTALAEIYDAP